MSQLVAAVIPLFSLVAVAGAVLATGLVLRHPHLPAWLRSEGVAQGAGLALTAAVCVAVGHAGSALIDARIHYVVATGVVLAVLAASTVVLWKLFGLSARLARADAGQSPFHTDRLPPQPLAAAEAA